MPTGDTPVHEEKLSTPATPAADVMDSPSERRRDVFSGLNAMKEVFDVSYAVHRMAEERARRKDLRRRQREGQASVFPNSLTNYYSDEEDDEDEDDEEEDEEGVVVQQGAEKMQPSQDYNRGVMEHTREAMERAKLSNHNDSLPSKMIQKLQRDRVDQQQAHAEKKKTERSNRSKAPIKPTKTAGIPSFELNMDNATLLGRRKHHVKEDEA